VQPLLAGAVPGRWFFLNGPCGLAGLGKPCAGGRAELQAEKGRVPPFQAARAPGAFFASIAQPWLPAAAHEMRRSA